jgi:RHS repeat-associated protein
VVLPTVTNPNDTALVHTRTPLIRATFTADAPIDTTTLVVGLGSDTVTALTRRNRGLFEWEVDASRQLSPGVNRDLYVKICHANNSCTEVTRHILLDNSGPPIVSFSGMPLAALGSHFGAPFGPGLSVHGAEVEAGFATPAYYSMGVARSAGLVYSTRQSYPRALVNVDVELTWPTGNPDQIRAYLFDGAVKIDTLLVNSPVCAAVSGRRCRVTLQGDFSSMTPAVRATRKWLKVEIRVTSGATTKSTTDSIEVVLVDRRTSPYGSGWYPGAALRLDSAGTDMLLVGPTGTATIYRGWNGVYVAPPGQTSVLLWTGTQWELRPRRNGAADYSNVIFDNQGRLTRIIDRRNNQVKLYYGAVDRVDSIVDPVGKKFTFTYSGGKLTTITDPGSPARQSRVTINASNQLVYDSAASSPATPAVASFGYTTYSGTNTVVLASRTDAAGQVTTVTYDARRRPTQVTLPAVLPDTGSTLIAPVIKYRAQELRALDTLLSADSIFVQITDPRGHWTRSTLSRWGAAERTWDALGTASRATFSAEGFVLWSDGKVADSTRVYQVYDALRRPWYSYRLRAPGDLVLLDSVVYDANHNVLRRYNALRQFAAFTYNASGEVTSSITPTNDTTIYQYTSQGQLSLVRRPLQTTGTTYGYHATWKNLITVTNPANVVLAEHTLDGYGRVIETRRKVTTRVNNGTTYMRWRRTLTGFQESNLVDSMRTEHTVECQAPCTTPPAWPTQPGDTLRWQHVKHAYDRLGRDTARFNSRDKRTRYVYDALGRLRMRFPFADSTAVVDSFRYDVAGNLRFHYTRRGNVIEHRYDSRNRDTSMVVPGVGTYRRVFGGPNDELTRLAIAGYADSARGVNPNLSWVYSQAGLLLADTAQGNRVTTYQHDRYGRDTLATDVRGATRLRYDAVRGMLDSVFTPYGDTLRWTVDARWRRVGPYIANGADPDFSTVATWDQAGKLTDLATTHATTVGHYWLPDASEPNVPDLILRPLWLDALGTAEDTLAHDGWGRVTTLTHLKNGSLLRQDQFTFDRDGNLRFANGESSRSYDVATTRLAARTAGGVTTTYAYDRAGNLATRTASGTTWTYTYDALDRLIVVRLGTDTVARYSYDAVGRRIVKRVFPGYAGAGYIRMIYRGGAVVAETDSVGTTLTLGYTWGLGTDNLVAVRRYSDSQTWYVIQDQLHQVRGLTKRDGTWVASWRYGAYGTVIDSAGAAPFTLRYRWTGRELDAETGLYFFRARYYDPVVSRFTQEDPIGFAGGLNLYGYGDGNPTNGRDPDGLSKNYDAWAFDEKDAHIMTNCWDPTCSGGGGGTLDGSDWNGDGLDDWFEFTEYSWGLQQFRGRGGTTAEWHSTWAGIMALDAPDRDFLMRKAFFGDIAVHRSEDTPERRFTVEPAMYCGEPETCTIDGHTYRRGDIILLGNPMPNFNYLDPDATIWSHLHYMRNVLVHETWHEQVCEALGRSCVSAINHDVEERSARAYAYRRTGWDLRTLDVPLPKP